MRNTKRTGIKRGMTALTVLLLLLLFAGCGGAAEERSSPPLSGPSASAEGTDKTRAEKADASATASHAEIPDFPVPKAPGTSVKDAEEAVIDYSNTADGYVMARFKKDSDKKLKAQVKGASVTYTYNMTPKEWEVFPLSEGSGEYTVTVYENIKEKEYATVASVTFTAALSDEFAPYLRPNQYVDYENARETLQMAADLTAGKQTVLDKVTAVYTFVIGTLSYDTALAESVQSGYLPVLDDVLRAKKGICFDYAALMTGMLRSQGVPTKLIVGFAGEAYHAWISVWSSETGWIENVVYFDGKTWQRMDPTFASSSSNAEALKKYIGDNSNYTEKYNY